MAAVESQGYPVRSVLDELSQALLADQRRQLAGIRAMAALDAWGDAVIAGSRQRCGAFGRVLEFMVALLTARDERMRSQADAFFAEWRELIAAALRRVRDAGQLRPDADLDGLALAMIANLQGGYVLARTDRAVDPVSVAFEMAYARIRFFADPG